LALVRLILSGANMLVLDEPTNHLDIHARAALEQSLLEYPGAMLFVSHDRYFVETVATKVLAVCDEALVHLIGGYEEYRALQESRRADEAAKLAARKREAKSKRRPQVAPGAQQAQEGRLLRSISKLEEEIRLRQDACGQEEHYRNPESMRRLKREIEELEAQLGDLYRKWEALDS
jgi:ATP-binding cassette subfamily F protein 3